MCLLIIAPLPGAAVLFYLQWVYLLVPLLVLVVFAVVVCIYLRSLVQLVLVLPRPTALPRPTKVWLPWCRLLGKFCYALRKLVRLCCGSWEISRGSSGVQIPPLNRSVEPNQKTTAETNGGVASETPNGSGASETNGSAASSRTQRSCGPALEIF
jgi:hypothetical protein